MTSTTSSMVMTPTKTPGLVDHGRRDEVIALEAPGHVLLVVRRLHLVGLVDHDLGDANGALGAQELVEGHRAEEADTGIDHEYLVERLGQLLRLAHEVDRLAHRPERRDGDELRLHQAAGAVLLVIEGPLKRDTLDRRQMPEDLGLIGVGEVLEDVDRIVRIEVAHALGDGFRLELLENFLADRVVDLGERREVEVADREAR
jgi:hypothetical protein